MVLLEEEDSLEELPFTYEDYVSMTEELLGMEEGSARYIRLFSISMVKDGEKIEPAKGKTVDVKIELLDSASEDLGVVHFPDEELQGSVIEDVAVDGQVLCFETDGFSVYSIVSQEEATEGTAFDGKRYVLVALNKNALISQEHGVYPGRLVAKPVPLDVDFVAGSMLSLDDDVTQWKFEAVPGQSGWYYTRGQKDLPLVVLCRGICRGSNDSPSANLKSL